MLTYHTNGLGQDLTSRESIGKVAELASALRSRPQTRPRSMSFVGRSAILVSRGRALAR